MKTTTTLQFPDLILLCKYIKAIHASAYCIDTTKMTIKLQLTPFERAIAVEQYRAEVVVQLEKV